MKKLLKYDKYIILGIIIAYFILLIFPCGQYMYGNHIDYRASGYSLIFGLKDGDYSVYKFNVYGFIVMLLYLSVIPILFIKKLKGKNTLVASIALSVFSIMSIFSMNLVNHGGSGVSSYFVVITFYYIFTILLALLSGFVVYLNCRR